MAGTPRCRPPHNHQHRLHLRGLSRHSQAPGTTSPQQSGLPEMTLCRPTSRSTSRTINTSKRWRLPPFIRSPVNSRRSGSTGSTPASPSLAHSRTLVRASAIQSSPPTENPITAFPSESAIHRRAESRGLKVEKLIGSRDSNERYMLIDAASGTVIRKELYVEELVDVLAAY